MENNQNPTPPSNLPQTAGTSEAPPVPQSHSDPALQGLTLRG